MPSRDQPKVMKWKYLALVFRDGERCFHCHKKPSAKRKWEIDHADNNPANDYPQNQHLLCRSCNLMFRGKSTLEHIKILENDGAQNGGRQNGRVDIRTSKLNLAYGNASPEMQANLCYEAQVNDWVLKIVDEHGSISRKEAINGSSAYAGCSPNTATRYIDKMTSIYEGSLIEYKENNQTMLKRRGIN
jgi:hypothetical protein